MKRIKLTQGFVATVDDADFARVNEFKWSVATFYSLNGAIKNRYAVKTCTDKTGKKHTQRMHCFILGSTGIDHADHDGLNNQRKNLRIATQTQQNGNRRKQANCSSKFKGVSKARNRWRMAVYEKGKRVRASFASEKEAAKAYDAAARVNFGVFACVNFPQGDN